MTSVGLAGKHIAAAQRGAQFFVVLDDAVVHQGHAGRAGGAVARSAMAEMRMGVAAAGAPCVAQRVWAMPVAPSM